MLILRSQKSIRQEDTLSHQKLSSEIDTKTDKEGNKSDRKEWAGARAGRSLEAVIGSWNFILRAAIGFSRWEFDGRGDQSSEETGCTEVS